MLIEETTNCTYLNQAVIQVHDAEFTKMYSRDYYSRSFMCDIEL